MAPAAYEPPIAATRSRAALMGWQAVVLLVVGLPLVVWLGVRVMRDR